MVKGYGIVICLGQWTAIKRIKYLNPLTLASRACHGTGFVGFNLETGAIVEHPGHTTIKLYEIARDNKLSFEELRNRLW